MQSQQVNQINRPEEAELRSLLYQARESKELRSVVALAYMKQDAALKALMRASIHEEMVRYQQQYMVWQDLMKIILTAPNKQ